jgi:hypothetical protein
LNDLIDAIIAFLEADIDSGDISAKKPIHKGLPFDFHQISMKKFPYIAIGDGGERTEPNESEDAQTRFYQVQIVLAAYRTDIEDSLSACLDLSNEVKASIESETNRQLDDIVWGKSIETFDWEGENGFYTGRSVIIEYRDLELTYARY